MKKMILLLLSVTASISNAQNAQDLIDGLKKELQTNPDEKRTATIYSDVGFYYATISLDSAVTYSNKAILELKKINDSTIISQVYSDAGAVYFRKGDFSNSKSHYIKAYNIRKKIKDFNGLNKVNINLASIYMETNEYNKAMKTYLESLKYFENINDEARVNVLKSNIGELYTKIKNYPKSIFYLKQAIAFNVKNNLNERLCESYLNLGNAYKLSGDTINTIKSYLLSDKFCTITGNKKALSIAKQGLAVMKNYQNKKQESNLLFQKSEKLKNEVGSELDKSNLKISQIRVLIGEKKYLAAYQGLKKIEKFFSKNNSKEDLLFVYKLLIPLYSKLNIADSTEIYTNKYTLLNEELMQNSISKSVLELETKYQTAKKEQEIAKKNNQILITSIIALAFLIFGFLLYRQQKIKNKQQKQESELQEALLKIENENQLQEQRLNISKELHDNIGSQLTFVISSIDTLKQNYPTSNDNIDSQLNNINSFAKNTIAELRDTVWVMNSTKINANALKERLVENMNRAQMTYENIHFNVVIDDFDFENSVVALHLFRTIQEAVNNALKYAQATQIDVSIVKNDNQIAAIVKDNGLGFNPETIPKGNGLKNMKKRILSVQGDFKIISEEKTGTQISILIPKTV